jgi:hypothetical protein
MMMNKIDNSGTGIASLGRNEDNFIAHVARGEMVVPPVISEDTRERLYKEMQAVGLDPREYTVGGNMTINPITGMPEFGWFKKTFKSVKKVIKKVAPYAAVIPGPWQPYAALYTKGRSVLDIAKGEGDIGDYLTLMAGGQMKLTGEGGVFDRMMNPKAFGQGGNWFDAFKDEASLFASSPIDYLKYIGGEAYDAYSSPFQGLFGGQQPQQPGQQMPGPGGFFQTGIGGLISGIGGGLGNILTGGTFSPGGAFGGNMGAAALAGLLGKVAYDAAKEREGGLAATPSVMMDPLGRYQLSQALGTGGTREEFGLGPAPKALEFAQGGPVMIEELDMRNGGESVGPGTGTSDDIPAMLSDGEYVMTAKAVRGAGSFSTKKTPQGIELIGGGDSSREAGVKNMRELMNMFEAI